DAGELGGRGGARGAWVGALDGNPAPVAEGMGGEQQLFLAFAQAWRGVIREPLLRQLMIVDGHSPSKYRALTVRNLDAWYAAFDVKSGQAMYLAPKDRVRVW